MRIVLKIIKWLLVLVVVLVLDFDRGRLSPFVRNTLPMSHDLISVTRSQESENENDAEQH